ncbi:MAG: DinB family protein [Rivularia sp. (in: cyanobacteria)]|mgnify:CR=1 FL=1
MLKQHFQMLASYNTLANRKLYEVCSKLSDAQRKQIRPAFFKSIHGTLNHIMIGDRIWIGRFKGQKVPSTRLDAILYHDFEVLQKTRMLEDRNIEAFISNSSEDFFCDTIKYLDNQGKAHNDPTELLMAHFFNHQTHHRGQIHDMLTQTEIAPPALGMHRILRP